MIGILIGLVVIIAAFAIVSWFLTQFKPPQPVLIIIYAALAILALYWLASVAGMAPGPPLGWRGGPGW